MNRSYMHICTVLSPGQVSVLLYPLALLKKWITKLLAFRGTNPIASCMVDVSVQALGERCFPKAPNLAYQLACTWACKDARASAISDNVPYTCKPFISRDTVFSYWLIRSDKLHPRSIIN